MAEYTTLRVRHGAAVRARRLSAVLALQADRRITLNDAIDLALTRALRDAAGQDLTADLPTREA